MEFDEDSDSSVTYVEALQGMSTYGKTEIDAVESTAVMLRV